MRHCARGLLPEARYSTSWRLSVTGAPPDCEGADIKNPNMLRKPDGQRDRVADQSPITAWTTASAASAAVSARNTRGPKPTAQTNGSLRNRSSSESAKPPSGPINTAHGEPATPLSAAAMGAD